jgi:hypothetical protein
MTLPIPCTPTWLRAVAAACLLAGAMPAQSASPFAEGFGRRAMAHVERLATPGGRVGGTEAEARAAAYVRAQLEAAGLSVTEEPFAFQAYTLEGATLRAGGRKADVLKLGFNPYTGGESRSGDLVFVESTQDLGAVLRQNLDDKIVVLVDGANLYALAMMANPRALVTLARADWERLRAAGAGAGEIAFRGRLEKRRSANIVGVLPAHAAGGKEIILSAHYDSWRGPGANDNASGVAVLLELARYYGALRPAPAAPIRFVAFGAEELGMLGARAYLARHTDELNRCRLLFNLDSVGGKGAIYTDTRGGVRNVGPSVRSQIPADLLDKAGGDIDARWLLIHHGNAPLFNTSNAPDWLRDAAAEAARETGRPHRAANNMGSDHRVFVQAGVVATGIALESERSRAHTPDDTPASLDPAGLETAARVAVRVVEKAAALTASTPPPASAPDPRLAAYLDAKGQTPEDYVIGKFAGHDLVFLGEYHRIRHDPELVGRLIPRLYRAGVRNLGIEFGVVETQADVDALLAAPSFDEEKARRILFAWFVLWPYREYLDLYRRAWEFNRTLPAGAPRFRIVHLNYKVNWSALRGERTREAMEKLYPKGETDPYMASVALREFTGKGEKALIYSGLHHAFTRYRQPRFNFAEQQLYGFTENRMGNVVWREVGDRAFLIVLHAPFLTKNQNESAPPAAGVIDAVMAARGNRPVGFDVKGSPFGKLADPRSYYAVGYPDYTLETLCDGYIFQRALADYEGVHVDPLFYSESNLAEAVANLPDPALRERINTVERLRAATGHDADIPARIRRLK